ncbi:MAG: GyrI-like domain-containing protein, partial [Candidatus Thorarchaeota archaeon]|nr:GyrI-like domain-containing protein [Candidatus Thorarchaeota archaeon]
MSVVHKKLEETLVAFIRIHGKFSDVAKSLEIVRNASEDKIMGAPIVVHHWLVQDNDGHDMDVCVPVSEEILQGEVKSMLLESCEAMTMIHYGPYESILDTYRKVTKETYAHGLPIAESGREVLLVFDIDNPENNVFEIQEVLHDWDNRFSKQLADVLGVEARDHVLKCYTYVSHESSLEDRAKAVKCAIDLLDDLATEDQKFEVLSGCAHVFPPELIAKMRSVYEETNSVDDVLEAMATVGNYPKFTREGYILYSSKQPYNPVAFAKATTRKEKMEAYCFCPMIKYNLDEVSGTF